MRKEKKKVEERTIYANYDENTIRVYQAYNANIAEEALILGTFGKNGPSNAGKKLLTMGKMEVKFFLDKIQTIKR